MNDSDASDRFSDDGEARARAERWSEEVAGHWQGYRPSAATQARIDARREEVERALAADRDRTTKPTEITRGPHAA